MTTEIADPLNSTLPPGRHGLSPEFIAKNQRTRLETGFGQAVREQGYLATTIATVCKAACVSRRTFYEHFSGKDALADAVMVKALAKSWSLDTGVGVWTIETLVRAEVEADAGRRECDLLEELIARVGDIEDPEPDSPLKPLPVTGKRQRLSPSFVSNGKRRRIVEAAAALVVEVGWVNLRIADLVKRAGVARKPFYDLFPAKGELRSAVVELASPELAEWLNGINLESGMAMVAIELVAYRIAGGDHELHAMTQAKAALRLVRAAVEDG